MLKDTVEKLFNALEGIGEAHEELYDTDVREQLAETLYFGFVWGHPLPEGPVTYGMFSTDADAAVAGAGSAFLKEAVLEANAEGIVVGERRHAAIQDANVVTKNGQMYDSFIGHSDEPFDPEHLPDTRFQRVDYNRR
jgi:hypothetical protein